MPTPDASQFIQMKKFQAIGARPPPTPANKVNTHLYQPVISVTGQKDFYLTDNGGVSVSNSEIQYAGYSKFSIFGNKQMFITFSIINTPNLV
jgi:hypothetical protein